VHSDAAIGAGLPGPTARVPRPTARLPQAVLVSCFLLPTMFLAHLTVSGALPPFRLAALASATVLGVLLLPGSRRGGPVLSAGLGQLLGQAVLGLPVDGSVSGPHGCLPVVGRGAELGLRLALFRQEQECPSRTLAQGPAQAAVTASLLSAATVLLAHALAAVWGPAVARWLTSSVAAASALLRGLRTLFEPFGSPPPAPCRRIALPPGPPRPRPPLVLGRTGRRGPPPLPAA